MMPQVIMLTTGVTSLLGYGFWRVGHRRMPALSLSKSRLQVAGTSMSLYGSLIVTNVLGFAFWWLAAHELPPREVGAGSAVVSAMQLLALLCVVGLNTLVISELSVNPVLAPSLIITGGLIAPALGMLSGIVVGVAMGASSSTLEMVFSNPGWIVLFGLGVAATTLTLVLDGACVGLLRGRLQFARNSAFAVAKLALVPVAALAMPEADGTQLLLIWILATIGSIWVVRDLVKEWVIGLNRGGLDFSLIRSHGTLALRHHWLNVAISAPRLALPVVAAVIVGTQVTAAFYIALLLVTFVNMIPTVLTTVLFALKPGDDATMRHQVRFTMSISGLVAGASAPLIFLGGRFALGHINHHYIVATTALWILGLTTGPAAVKAHYVAVARVANRLARAALFASVGALFEVALAALGGAVDGVSGIALGWLIALCFEAVAFGPTVVRALRVGAVR